MRHRDASNAALNLAHGTASSAATRRAGTSSYLLRRSGTSLGSAEARPQDAD